VRARIAIVSLAVLTLLTSCESLSEGWTYSITRSMLSGFEAGQVGEGRIPHGRAGYWGDDETGSIEGLNGKEGLAVLLGVVILLPIALDTVLLPVTYTHDLVAE
jgi:hypothetical protein